MKIRTIACTATVAFLLLAPVACGGSDDAPAGRPSQSELEAGITKGLAGNPVPAGLVPCVAKAMHDSDLPDDALRAVVEGRVPTADAAAKERYGKFMAGAYQTCTAANVTTTTTAP